MSAIFSQVNSRSVLPTTNPVVVGERVRWIGQKFRVRLCQCVNERILALCLWATYFIFKNRDEEYFGRLREAILGGTATVPIPRSVGSAQAIDRSSPSRVRDVVAHLRSVCAQGLI